MLEHDITASSIAKNDETKNDISEIAIENKDNDQQGSDIDATSQVSEDDSDNKLAELNNFLKSKKLDLENKDSEGFLKIIEGFAQKKESDRKESRQRNSPKAAEKKKSVKFSPQPKIFEYEQLTESFSEYREA